MKKSITGSLCGLLLTAAVAQAQIVIANPSVGATAVSADELKAVYLAARSSLADGSAVEPVLAQGGATHEAFLAKYVGKSDQALRNHLKGLVFTGKASMPKSFASDAEIVSYVARQKGAIAYVSAEAETTGVKKLPVR